MTETILGRPIDRVDGRLKTTGQAKYASDHRPIRSTLHGVLLKSTIANGQISAFETSQAASMPGFVRFISHLDGALIRDIASRGDAPFFPGELLTPFLSADIHFVGQHIGIVLAKSREVAEAAAATIVVHYEQRPAQLSLHGSNVTWERPILYNTGEELQITRGDTKAELRNAVYTVDQHYGTPAEHHNPIETSSTVAEWDGDSLVLYDATQGNTNSARYVAYAMGVGESNVRVVNQFVGGGFGCKGFAWPHTLIAAAAARAAGCPVSLSLSRSDMYTSCGHRPNTEQHIVLGANAEGQLLATRHTTRSYRSPVGDHVEPCGLTTAMLYASKSMDVVHEVAELNLPSGTPMRGPGEASGTFALESAMDELAETVGIDPIELRRRNHTEIDPRNGRLWSSKNLLRCYDEGAAAFRWSERQTAPASRVEGNEYVGFGMATACYPGYRMPARARLKLDRSGQVLVEAGVQDIGTGAYTIIAQMVAEGLGVAIERVTVRLGDTALPEGPLAGGSMTTASIASAVDAAIQALRDELEQVGVNTAGANPPLFDLFMSANQESLSVESGSETMFGFAGGQETDLSFYSFGAIFVEARVDKDFGIVTLPRMLGVFDAGRVLNSKTAESQMFGGMTFGIGMALLEETEFGPDGRVLNPSLGEYYVPVNADVQQLDVRFIDEPDYAFNPLGARGIGELGCVGAAAAIANAVYNACGVRVRELPIRLDKLMEGMKQ
ncbi:xanthine dehydrogenase family protein molybdopterin-binding subunit [Roseibium sp. HPY-6]|uniref:xanthine dehydrogenase family protein molybdopterin-binding subunit n=1 Tax=Roseibium sp. HPY-6 TaxID=3229852 RepID=UPI00338DC6D8